MAASSDSAFERTYRLLALAVTGLIIAAGLGLLAWYYYPIVALLGIVLVVTYLLVWPVDLAEKGLSRFSAWTGRLPGYGWLVQQAPEVNPRILAVMIVYFLFFMLITLSAVKIVPELGREVTSLSRKLPGYLDSAYETVIDWSNRTPGGGFIKQFFRQDIEAAEKEGKVSPQADENAPISTAEKEVIRESVRKSTIGRVAGFTEETFKTALANLTTAVTGTLAGFVFAVSGLVLIFYFLLDGQRLRRDFLRILPETAQDTAAYFLGSFHAVMSAFIKGQVLLGMLTGVYMFIIYTFFGVPYAIFLGVLTAVAEFLPVVGTYIGITPGLLVALFTIGPIKTLIIWGLSYAFQTVKDNILTPKIQGGVMGLHPLVVLLALIVCAKVAGLVGILFALPLASAFNVVIRYLTHGEKVAG